MSKQNDLKIKSKQNDLKIKSKQNDLKIKSEKNDPEIKLKYKVTYPYKNLNYTIEKKLEPGDLRSNYYVLIKKQLKDELEGKCNEDGYIERVNKIIMKTNDDKSNTNIENIIPSWDLTGSVNYKITYNVKICIPMVGDIYIAKIKNIFVGAILAKYDKIDIMIYTNDKYNKTNFEIDENNDNLVIKKTGKLLNIGDDIYVSIIRIKLNNNVIITFAQIEDIL
jgi:DNA-directed RNA polymerase subunit E'/Rpb7